MDRTSGRLFTPYRPPQRHGDRCQAAHRLGPFRVTKRNSDPVYTRHRADRIRLGIESLYQLRQDIADAYAARDWVPLGYASWEGYCEGEFGAGRLAVSRDERPELVNFLREQGLSYPAIAAATGMGYGTAYGAAQAINFDSLADEPPIPVMITLGEGKRGSSFTDIDGMAHDRDGNRFLFIELKEDGPDRGPGEQSRAARR